MFFSNIKDNKKLYLTAACKVVIIVGTRKYNCVASVVYLRKKICFKRPYRMALNCPTHQCQEPGNLLLWKLKF